jgi:hypothetical protein
MVVHILILGARAVNQPSRWIENGSQAIQWFAAAHGCKDIS